MATDNWIDGSDFWNTAGDWSAGVPTSSDDVVVAEGAPFVDAPISANSITNSASIDFGPAGGAVATFVDNSGVFSVMGGGATLTVGDTFTNAGISNGLGGTVAGTGELQVGQSNGSLTADDWVVVGALDNFAINSQGQTTYGTINIFGGASAEATLWITSGAGLGAAGEILGDVNISGRGVMFFSGDSALTEIAPSSELTLDGASASVAVGATAAINNGLFYLQTVSGGLNLIDGAEVKTNFGLTNNGTISLDASTGDGGSGLNVEGVLTNAGKLVIGPHDGSLAASDTVSATGVDQGDDGVIDIDGGAGGELAELNVTGVAGIGGADDLYGAIDLSGDALLQFASGEIGNIESGATLSLTGADAFVADVGSVTSNSALSGLATNGGTLDLAEGAELTTGGLANDGTIALDSGGGAGGTDLSVDGALDNSGTLEIGPLGATLALSDIVAATSVDNSGGLPGRTATIDINGGGELNVTGGPAGFDSAGILDGTVNLGSGALLQFAEGQITDITGSLTLSSSTAFVADAGHDGANSALTGVGSITGQLTLMGGADPTIDGPLQNQGIISLLGGGGLTIDEALDNAGLIDIGNGLGSATLKAQSYNGDTTSTLIIAGGQSSSSSGTFDVAGAAPANLLGQVTVTGDAQWEFASGSFTTIQSGSSLTLVGASAVVNDASNASTNDALAGLTANLGTLDLEQGAWVQINPADDGVTNSGTIELDQQSGSSASAGTWLHFSGLQGLNNQGSVDIGPGATLVANDVTGPGTILINGGKLQVDADATGGAISFGSPGGVIDLVSPGSAVGAIESFAADDSIQLGYYTPTGEAVWYASASGGTLEIVDPDAQILGTTLLLTAKFVGSFAGEAFAITEISQPGNIHLSSISLVAAPWANVAPGDVLVTNVSGQSYSAYEQIYSNKTYEGVDYIFTNVTNAPYDAYAYDYSAGNEFIGSQFYYPGPSGASYANEEVDYDGEGRLVRAAFSGVAGAPYSSYEYDFVGGVFAGSKFTYTSVPAGASYSSFEVDYDATGAFAGEEFFFANVTGQSYADAELDFDASLQLSRIVLSGVTGQAYSSLELDYSAGAYEGYKAYYTGVTGQNYKEEEVDVSAAGALEKVVFSGMTGTPYSSVEQDFSNGALADVVYDYTDVTNQTYYAYQVMEDPSGNALQETFDLNSGGHALIALTTGQTLASLGNDKMTGDGATTFALDAVYGADVITNFTTADTISLPTAEFANFSAVMNAASNVGSNVVIAASDGDTLTLKDMTTATLAGMSSNFIFHA